MKKMFILSFLFLSSTVFAKDIAVTVNGMVCSLCAQGIQKKFKSMDEVKEIKVDLDKKIVLISTKDDKDINDSTIKEIITEAGYNVSNIERK